MDYEAIDREMSCYVVTSVKNGVRLFLTDQGLGTDMLSLAKRYRYDGLAQDAANSANQEYAWRGFTFVTMSVPEALNAQ